MTEGDPAARMVDRVEEGMPEELRRALRRRDYIQLRRSIEHADRLEGYVVALGRRWVVLYAPSNGNPCGYVIVPVRDVRRIYWASGGRFVRRSLKLQGAWPPAAPKQALALDGSTRALVHSVARTAPLLTIHTERFTPEACYIGAVAKEGRQRLHLIEVDTDGRWWKRTRSYRWDWITRVDVGGDYEINLARVAGPRV